MARIINDRFIFIHVAKTGGTFFREALNCFGVPNRESGDFSIEDHYSIFQVKESHPELKNMYSFGFVRNPVSWYRYRWAYGMLTYFPQKLKFIPEAQNHWMAKVWSNNLDHFVANTIEAYPNGIALDYFNKMLGITVDGGVSQVHRFEELITFVQMFMQMNNRTVSIDEIKSLPIARSSQLVRDQITPSLVKDIEHHERALMNLFY